ncbi:MAG: branched-chain amino acid ABC transporter permease [Hyphomicrobiaceae bacterium]|nr:branched-chain amino acid ABC transporter permease [Hyphomicrobiaceae bacterium]
MELLAQLLANTLQIGAVYVLFALGLTLIFGVMKVVNFAHGEFFSLAALIVAASMPLLPAAFPSWLNYLVALAAAIAAVAVLGAIIYRIGFERYLRDLVGSFILSVGLILLLQGIMTEIFTASPRPVDAIVTGNVTVLGARITAQRLLIMALALLFTGLLYVVLQRTRLGKALRAASEDREAAMLQGIRYRTISLYGWLIGVSMAGLAGALMAPLSPIQPAIGADYLIKAFIIIIVGGLGSIPGAIVGGLLVAAIESVCGFYFDLTIATIFMFVLVMAFLLVRPQGLMGHVER